MDMGSERMVLNALKPVTEGRTVVIVTHKPALLEFVDRIIIMDEGIRVADGPKATIIEAINSGKVPSAAAVRNAHKSMPQPAAA
jgi:ATP-binding cassette subfamily C protein LapB